MAIATLAAQSSEITFYHVLHTSLNHDIDIGILDYGKGVAVCASLKHVRNLNTRRFLSTTMCKYSEVLIYRTIVRVTRAASNQRSDIQR